MTVLRPLPLLLLLVPLTAQSAQQPQKDPKEPEKISYYKDIRPIFVQNCQGCHQPAKAEGGLLMTSHAELFKKGDSDEPGVVPGDPAKSLIYQMIVPEGDKPPRMPRGKEPLSAYN